MLLSSHVWRQDHNGFSHQDPGFVDVLLNKTFNNDHVVNIYYPADANLLLAVAERCYTSTNCVNAVFAGKQPAPTWVTLDEAREELSAGAAEWKWASNTADGEEPDIVLGCCGDVPTQETMAALELLDKLGVKCRLVNVVELLKIQNASENDEALSDEQFTALFTADKPVLFAFHAYPGTVHRLIWDRPNHDNFHVHGYEEQGSTTTPYDMLRLNHMDRWALAADALRILDAEKWADQIAEWEQFRQDAFQFAVDNGYDHPAFTDWVWHDAKDTAAAISATKATGGDNE
jgi:xylulose-5-phosphate/fructose-6-phosphate phosphoketolase